MHFEVDIVTFETFGESLQMIPYFRVKFVNSLFLKTGSAFGKYVLQLMFNKLENECIRRNLCKK